MTSPLRRKRPTTARSTLPTPKWTAWAVAGLLAAALAESQPACAADRSAADSSAVQAASYSTGKSGSRLKWVSRRPAPARTDPAVTETQFTSPDASCEPSCDGVRAAQELEPSSEAWSKSLRNGKPSPAEHPGKEPSPAVNGKKKPGGKPSLLDQELAPRQHGLMEGCPSPKDLKHIRDLNTSIAPSEGALPRDCPLGDDAFQGRSFAPITFTWTASQLCHKPLYFEDVQLERYGHMAGPWVQPFASAANFFATFPILPYKMGLELPNECIYTLGYYRPGDCAPYLFDPLPLSVRGMFFEAGAWVGACALFPGMGAPHALTP
jgi:hypothetical protein